MSQNATTSTANALDLVLADDSYPYQCFQDTNTFHWKGIASRLAESRRSIVVESGDWDSSRLASHIYEILLRDILGYDVTNRLYWGGAATGARLRSGDSDVSIELWQADASYYREYITVEQSVIYAGQVGYVGKNGWYIPSWVVAANPNIFLDFWRSLDDPRALAVYPRSDIPRQCVGNPNCVDPSYSVYFNERLIDGLMLNITIRYLGQNYAAIIQDALDRHQAIMFFSWTPAIMTAQNNLTRLQFPVKDLTCLDRFLSDRQESDITCDYPIDFLFKASSVAFQRDFPYAFQLLELMKISNGEIDAMLRDLAETSMTSIDYGNVACQWINDNEDIWASWIPPPPVLDVESCPVGQGKYNVGSVTMCLVCSDGTYNWNPINPSGCQSCPELATCLGGSNVTPQENFWIDPSSYTATIYPCPISGVCWSEPWSNNMTSQCSNGLGGLLCTQCVDQSLYEWGGQCVACPNHMPGSILFFVWMASLAFVVFVHMIPKSSGATLDILVRTRSEGRDRL
ncbi:uncharacterized protein BJ171DRAFT_601292 [Polychytrium aggregatum]|uniref:uncharacterized protein n=1 Tax=Polychytrium aggregatum TaxID=110093 RepID=UPI0022FE94EA|nr:uncharacterized protein BJ171DRAFT_601292 [Polychytrium aggregatum]KAI9201932.1 hypothetical protein BJ171DRAFT_601292 [Polychytrium aggregatum]